MLRDTAIRLIAQRCGRRTDLDADIKNEMVFAHEVLCQGNQEINPWFLERDDTTSLIATASAESIALPADFLGEIEGWPIRYYDADADEGPWVEMIKDDYENMLSRPTDDDGRFYAIFGGMLYLRPVFDADTQLRLFYKVLDTPLSGEDDIENMWLKYASDIVMGETGAIIAGQYVRNTTVASVFTQQAQRGWQRLLKVNESRKHTNRDYAMGDD